MTLSTFLSGVLPLGKFGAFSDLPAQMLLGLGVALLAFLLIGKKIKEVNVPRWLLPSVAIITFITLFTLSLLKHYAFYSTGYDLGIYDQTLAGYLKGALYSGIVGYPLLGMHVEVVLFLLLPFYALFKGPVILLFFQALALAASVFPLHRFSRKWLGEAESMLLVFSWLFFPTLLYVALFDFHPVALAVPAVMYAVVFLEEKKMGKMLLMLLLATLCKEIFSFLFITFGAYVAAARKKWLLGGGMALFGALWFAAAFYGVSASVYQGPNVFFEGNPYFGNTVGESIVTVLTRPLYTLAFLFQPEKMLYGVLMLLPVAGMALLAPELLWLGASELGLVLLYSPISVQQALYHHSLLIAAIAVLAAAKGIHRLGNWLKGRHFAIAVFVAVMALSSQLVYGPFSVLYCGDAFNPYSQHAKDGRAVLSALPSDAEVMAPNWALPHVSAREFAYTMNGPLGSKGLGFFNSSLPEYILLDNSDAWEDPKRNAGQLTREEMLRILGDTRYGPVNQQGSWVLLKKGAPYVPKLESKLSTEVGCPVVRI
ncbi:MAG: DUF2079 domain-containing protein [Nanoarchaeota archaeon]|nr:DUF2079 domain-containing protein [Nanoarchaeota archaeon]